jgi:hypothetical protein
MLKPSGYKNPPTNRVAAFFVWKQRGQQPSLGTKKASQ